MNPETSTPRWHVYLLQCADNSLYCGIAIDPIARLASHNGLRAGGARYTRGRRPSRIAGIIECADKSAALRLERAVKAMRHYEKLLFFGLSTDGDARA